MSSSLSSTSSATNSSSVSSNTAQLRSVSFDREAAKLAKKAKREQVIAKAKEKQQIKQTTPTATVSSAATSSSSSVPSSSSSFRLSILCLHGYSQNVSVFEHRLGSIRSALKTQADFDYLEGTHRLDFRRKDEKKPNGIALDTHSYSWWKQKRRKAQQQDDKGEEKGELEYSGIAETLNSLKRKFHERIAKTGSGYDGIFGFSQGGGLAALLVAIHAYINGEYSDRLNGKTLSDIHPELADAENFRWLKSLKFVIIVSGFVPRADRFQLLYQIHNSSHHNLNGKSTQSDSSNNNSAVTSLAPAALSSSSSAPLAVSSSCSYLFSLPSLHVWGLADTNVASDESIHLSSLFHSENRMELIHSKAHIIPADKAQRLVYADFLKRIQERTQQ